MPAIKASGNDAAVNDVVRKNAQFTVEALKENSDIIKEAINSGKVAALAAYYNLDTGKVDFL